MLARLLAITAGCMALCLNAARAEQPLDASVAPFWQAAHNPAMRRAQTLIRQGRAQLYPAMGSSAVFGGIGRQRRATLDNALARLERAERLEPQSPQVLFLAAQALTLWEVELPDGLVRRRDAEAIAKYQALRALDPTYEEYQVAFDLGILYTREGQFDKAADEYRRALDVHLDEGSVSTVTANLAEVTMTAGDLVEAARLYEQSMNTGAGEERLLPMWGLSVALDRLGEHTAAIETAQRAAEEDRRPMAVLGSPGVFFVPPHEAYYYTGLGHVALASRQLGHALSACKGQLTAGRALTGASREQLLEVVQLSEQLRALDGDEARYKRLVADAQARLKERNDDVRHGRSMPREDEPTAAAFLHALTALRDYRSYLGYSGDKGPWSQQASDHVDDLRRCLAL